MKQIDALLKSVKYYFYFISLSFYFSYGYFYMFKKHRYNGLINLSAA